MSKKFNTKRIVSILMVLSLIVIMAGCSETLEYYTISGLVRDLAGNPIPDAAIAIKDGNLGTVTAKSDDKGKWSASVAAEELTISVSKSGYKFEPDTVTFKKGKDKSIEFIGEPFLTVSPAGGTYNEPVTVEMSIGGDYTIYYTLDGSEPTENSNKYTGPFEISETCTLKAKGFSGSSETNVVTVEYIIDLSKDYGIIKNGGFEEGIEPWEGHFGAKVELSTEQFYKGSYSIKTVNRTMTGHGPKQVITDVVEPGATYEISATVYYDAETAPAERDFNLTFQNGEYPDWISVAKTVTVKKGEWTTIETTYKVPEVGTLPDGLDLSQEVRVLVETSWVPDDQLNPDNDLFDFYVDEFYMKKVD